MSIATFRAVTERFLRENRCQVLAIKGTWGVGKTFAWKAITEALHGSIWPPTYSYVSLFGLSSVSDVRAAIVANARPTEAIGKRLTLSVLNERWRQMAVSKLTWLRRKTPGADAAPWLRGVSLALDTIAPMFAQDLLICFDDFERINAAKLSHDELMGLISTLKENSNCKVAIILNEEKLPDGGAAYKLYREKVVDLELQFSPTAEEAMEWGLPSDLPERAVAADIALKLGITNVRVLRRIADVIMILAPAVSGLRQEVRGEAVASAVIIGWCHFDRSGSAPGPDYLRSWNTFSRALKEEKTARSKDEERWAALLSNMDFAHFDDFDAAILSAIERGYLEESGFAEQANKRNQLHQAGDLERAFREAWGLFHQSFEDNADEVVSALESATKRAAAILNPTDVNAVVTLLRQLGRGGVADELITYYVNERKGSEGLFDLGNSPFGSYVTDARMREIFAATSEDVARKVPLREAVETMAKGQGWSAEDEQAVSSATTEDFYKLFKGPLSVQKQSAIKACLRFNAPPRAHVAPRVMEALQRLGRESAINAVRVRACGIDVSKGAADATDSRSA